MLMPELPELPAIATAPLAVVLPVHNAEAYLETGVVGWVNYLETLCRPYTVLLVNDGSTDRTAELAEGLARRFPRLQVLTHATRQGYGASLRTALPSAQAPLLFYGTCDGQYRPEDLNLLLKEIDAVHLVSGGRTGRPTPSWLRGLGFVYRLLIQRVFGVPLEPLTVWPGWRGYAGYRLLRLMSGVRIVDVCSPFKLFRREIFARIPIQSDSDFVHAEVLAKANFLNCLMNEVPISWRWEAAPERDQPADRNRFWADAHRVWKQPDFGPAVLPKTAAESQAAPPPPPA
jgi:glycosyltransferase involved in cell wall biosynthesis